MAKYTASFLGRDCPGVVAAVSGLFGDLDCNIEAMSQTMLSGEFAAIFVISAPENHTAESLRAALVEGLARENVDLSVMTRPAIGSAWGDDKVCEPFVVTVDGPDGPGLIGAMSKVFGRHEVNIENLTAILEENKKGSAMFVFEVMAPLGADIGRMRRELACEAKKLNLRVSVQHRRIFEAAHRLNAF